MEKVEENGLTFYRFEAQGRMQLDLETVNHFYLTDELQGAQADFFRAVGAPSPFPFFRDPRRKHVPVIQVAYAGIGLGPVCGTFSCGCCGKSAHAEESYQQALDGMSGAVEVEGIEIKRLYGKSITQYNQKQ